MYLNEYETVYISSSELSEENYNAMHKKLVDTIEKSGGKVLTEEKWGRRKLAYPIRKQLFANYTLIDFAAPPNLPSELQRISRLDDSFMRLLTVKIGDKVDVEAAEEAAKIRSTTRLEKLTQ